METLGIFKSKFLIFNFIQKKGVFRHDLISFSLKFYLVKARTSIEYQFRDIPPYYIELLRDVCMHYDVLVAFSII